jgi:hypothetical protein
MYFLYLTAVYFIRLANGDLNHASPRPQSGPQRRPLVCPRCVPPRKVASSAADCGSSPLLNQKRRMSMSSLLVFIPHLTRPTVATVSKASRST